MLSWWPQSLCSSLLPCLRQFWSKPSASDSPHRRIGGGTWWRSTFWGDAHSVSLSDLANNDVSKEHKRWCPAYVPSEQAVLNTTEVTRQQCSVSLGWQPTNDLTSPPVDLSGRGRDAQWILGVAVGIQWDSNNSKEFGACVNKTYLQTSLALACSGRFS